MDLVAVRVLRDLVARRFHDPDLHRRHGCSIYERVYRDPRSRTDLPAYRLSYREFPKEELESEQRWGALVEVSLDPWYVGRALRGDEKRRREIELIGVGYARQVGAPAVQEDGE